MQISDSEPQLARRLFLVSHSENPCCPVPGISQPSLSAELVDDLAGVRGSITGILFGIASWTMIFGLSRIIKL
jgi:hypothetical protein